MRVLWIVLAVTATVCGVIGDAKAGGDLGPASRWEIYVGWNAGYGFGPWDASSNQAIFVNEVSTAMPQVNGPMGGLQAGINWQPLHNVVLGIETDADASGARDVLRWFDARSDISWSNEWDLTWAGTSRFRVGYTPTPRLMLYGTAGLAYGSAQYKIGGVQPGENGGTLSLSKSTGLLGYALGAGAESKINPNWSGRLEFLYLDFGSVNDSATVNGALLQSSFRVRELVARAGFNYAFH